MAIYASPDLQFAYPPDWQDRSVVAFAAPPDPSWKLIPNFVVTRDVAADGETIFAYADRQLVMMAQQLNGFSLVRRSAITLGGHESVEMVISWHSGQGVVEQRQVMVLTPDRRIFSFVGTALQSDVPNLARTFDLILSTIRFPALET
jgi:hypothetical protein